MASTAVILGPPVLLAKEVKKAQTQIQKNNFCDQ